MNYVIVDGNVLLHRRQFFAAYGKQTRRQLFHAGKIGVFRRRKDAENYLKRVRTIRREIYGGWV